MSAQNGWNGFEHTPELANENDAPCQKWRSIPPLEATIGTTDSSKSKRSASRGICS